MTEKTTPAAEMTARQRAASVALEIQAAECDPLSLEGIVERAIAEAESAAVEDCLAIIRELDEARCRGDADGTLDDAIKLIRARKDRR